MNHKKRTHGFIWFLIGVMMIFAQFTDVPEFLLGAFIGMFLLTLALLHYLQTNRIFAFGIVCLSFAYILSFISLAPRFVIYILVAVSSLIGLSVIAQNINLDKVKIG